MLEKENKYHIEVHTSNLPNSGIPSSNVFVQLFGKKGKKHFNESKNKYIDNRDTWSIKFPLSKSQNSKKFLPGQIDQFEIEENDIGKLNKIRVSHDSKSSWHLKKIIIIYKEKKLCFYCNKNVLSEIDLFPSKISSENDDDDEDENKKGTKINKIRYDIKIKTSQYSKQALKFDIKIIGNKSETNKIKLNNSPSDKEKEKFLTDSLDFFKLIEDNVGVIEKIFIYCKYNPDKKPCDWFFDYLVIDQPSENLRYRFNSKSLTHVKEDSDKEQTVLEIYPIETRKTSEIKMIYKIELYVKKMCKQKEYILENMSLQIFGDFGRSIELKPRETKKINCTCDTTSNVDVIHFHSHNLDLGNIFKVKLVLKNPLKKLVAWYLEKARVIHDKEEWTFPFQKWINLDKKEKKKEIKIFDDNYRKSRKDFFKDNKFSRTVSTLNHRLLTEESMNDDSYDDSFDNDEHSQRSPSSSPGRSPTSNNQTRQQRRRSISDDRNKSNDRGRRRERSSSRSRSSSSIEDALSSRQSGRRRRSRTISVERIPSPDLPSYKFDNKLKSSLSYIKEKSPDYLDFKIEDKFEKRYANLTEKNNNNDFRFKANNSNNFRTEKVNKTISIDDDLEKRFQALRSDNNNNNNNSYRKNTTDYIDDDYGSKSIHKNDLKLDLNQTITKNKTNKNFEFENDKELNKIYEGFFNTDKSISIPNNNKNNNNFSRENFKNSYLAEMNSFNLDNLNKSYKPTFH